MRVARLARELAVLSSAFLIGCSGSSEKLSLPKLVVSPHEVDLGRVPTDSEGERQVSVRLANRGTSPLKIMSVSSSCGCTVVQNPRAVIGAGESDTMTIFVRTGIEPGQRGSRVRVATNDPNRPDLEIPIRWTAVSPLAVEPSSIDFGELRPGAVATQVITVGTTTAHETDGVQAEGFIPGGHWDWKGPWRDDGTRELAVTLSAGEGVGPHGGSIRLNLGVASQQVLIPVRWSVVSRIESLPHAIFSARVEPAREIRKVVRIRSRQGERFRIRGVTFDGAGGKPETDAVSSEPANEHEISVRWTVPTERGIHRLLIRVDTDLMDTEPVSVPWSVVVS